MRLGAHVGISDGLAAAAVTARKIGCEVLQIFSRSPQMWGAAPIDPEVAREFREAMAREGLGTSAIHQSYLPNLASPDPAMLKKSRKAFVDELHRADLLGIPFVLFHPGAHTGAGVEPGLRTIVESIDWAVGETPGLRVRGLLENSAGQGSTLCARMEELGWILEHVSDRTRVGVALDTCHLFAAGFDFRTDATYADLLETVEDTFGRKQVLAFHLNDSKGPLGSHLDRHENIGKGELGLEGFSRMLNDRQWSETPGYLETPLPSRDYSAYEEDLRTLRALVGAPAKKPTGRTKARARAARASAL